MSNELRERLQASTDRYQIGEQVGEGGMAVVFRARDAKHDRDVAIKVMKPDLDSVSSSDRFLREIDIAAKLTHPHVLPLFDSGQAAGLHYLVMPFVEEESLRDHLDRVGALPVDQAIRITREVASALTYAHGRGLVHRDIKPENILLQSGHATVTDFGIARLLDTADETGLTKTGTSIGTFTYMSPEQAAGDVDVDGRTDVYALGCVLYEMLEGRPPFDGRSPQAMLASKLTGELPKFSEERRIPVTISSVVHRSLSVEREDRHATPEALSQELERAATTRAIEAAAAKARNRRTLRTAGALVATLVAIAVLGWLSSALRGPSMQRIAVLPFENEAADTAQDFFIDGMHEALITEMQQAGIEVIGRRSVMQYRDDDSPVREIASVLDVDGVVEAIAFRGADSVGLRVRLVDGVSEAGVWQADFGAPASGVLRVYREATAGLADAIGLRLSPEVAARLASAPPVDPAAYEAYLNGKGHWNRLAPEDLVLAEQYFERALQIAPDYALGHAGIATLWLGLQQMGLRSPTDAAPVIEEAVASALRSDSTIAEAHLALAMYRTWGQWDWSGGEEAFLRALEINPAYADARAYYAHLLIHLDRDADAIEQARLAVEIEPVSPLIGSLECVVWGHAGRPLDALERCQGILDRDPRQIVARDGLAVALTELGRYDEHAANEAIRARALGIDWMAEILEQNEPGGYATTFSIAADSMVARLQAGEFVPPSAIAMYLSDAGRGDESLAWLERAVALRDPAVPYMLDAKSAGRIENDPRFRAIFDAVGLPERR